MRKVMSFITSTSTPPKAERDHFAEARIGHGADHDFLPALQHLLHLHTLNRGIFSVPFGVLDQFVESAPDLGGIIDTSDHASGFGLVKNIIGNNLQHNGESKAPRELDRFGRGLCQPLLRRGMPY